MGMDGLSMANTGVVKESTSADYASRAEQIVQSDPANDSKQVQTMGTNRRVREKDENEGNRQRRQGQESGENQEEGEKQEEFQDGLVEAEQSDSAEEEFDIQDLENPSKDFYVKLNAKDDIIELYDSTTDRLIETISGNELRELVKKLNMASGIFINKKV